MDEVVIGHIRGATCLSERGRWQESIHTKHLQNFMSGLEQHLHFWGFLKKQTCYYYYYYCKLNIANDSEYIWRQSLVWIFQD